jgi:S-adenosylmethionine:tRNA ribosyltransferase-isomerase
MNTELDLANYDYCLPKELIAQSPSDQRDKSRLLVLNRKTLQIEDTFFSKIIRYLNPGDCLVINKTKVVASRLFGKKETGGKVEVLFIDPLANSALASALVKPFLTIGSKIIFPDELVAEVIGKNEFGETVLKLSGWNLSDVLQKHGHMPLPPYIKNYDDKRDKKRYQTVYASCDGSIAAPTAGLHFTDHLINDIKKKGVEVVEIILHVGWGTFKSIVSQNITEHKMLPERYEINAAAAEKIVSIKKSGGRIFSVGTTTTRALESCAKHFVFDKHKKTMKDISGATDIFIHPGYQFKAIDCLITNFHTPQSTPLLMACAFVGKKPLFDAYEHAIKEKYRFFSYGDAMLIC